MSLGACCLIRRFPAVVIALCAIMAFSSCGTSAPKTSNSGLPNRGLASQSVTSAGNFGALYIINGQIDTIPPVSPIAAGNTPSTMAISPSRNIVAAFDSSTYAIYSVNTATEKSIGSVKLPGCTLPPCPTPSFVVPTSNQVGYAAIPTATVNGFSFLGAVEVMNLAGGIVTTIAVTNAQTVVPASSGGQLLVFSNDSNSITVLTPGNAVPPVDTSCLSGLPNSVCTVISGFDHPVNAVVNNNIAYILNCGPQCGGTRASVMILDLSRLVVTAMIPVDAAYIGLLNGSTLYVAGTSPSSSNSTCTNQTTAATTCGRLDTIDLTSNTVTSSLAITDGYHSHIDISIDGQLFVGSYDCTEINNGNTSTGEVRGCLTILDTTTGALIFPPYNGQVDGLQSFTTRRVEYVAQGGILYVYNTQYDLLLIDDYILTGEIVIVGYVSDVKAIDFF